MSYAMKEINELKSDTIEDQKTIIMLQQDVIGQKHEEIDGVKNSDRRTEVLIFCAAEHLYWCTSTKEHCSSS